MDTKKVFNETYKIGIRMVDRETRHAASLQAGKFRCD